MIEDTLTLDGGTSALGVPFQDQMLQHWCEILDNRKVPRKRDFRPQKFPKFLPQLAIVSLTPDEHFEDRLTGTTVADMLGLGKHTMLHQSTNPNVRALVDEMLGQAGGSSRPMYFKGNICPNDMVTVDFSALVLPFTQKDDDSAPDTFLLAFDFTRTPSVDGIKVVASGE